MDANGQAAAESAMRRYDLDWLRVLAFGLLILYHVGMYYVADWGWHIKSPDPSAALQNAMYLVNPWRMSLLFFVSGAALFFACRKLPSLDLVQLRNKRLLLPLVFSMVVIIPPQLYVELVTGEGMQRGYLVFYSLYLDAGTDAYPEHQHGPLGLWTWNHLWFLAYLWVYTLVFVILRPLLERMALWLHTLRVGVPAVVLIPVALLTIYRVALASDYPPSNALFGDWYNHARYLTLLFGGYLMAGCGGFWEIAVCWRWRWLTGALAAYGVLLLIAHDQVGGLLPFLDEDSREFVIRVFVSIDQWLWILALLGLGRHYLNRPSPALRYMNEAILPWYILHQTLIVLLAFSLAPAKLWQPLEALLLIVGTVAGCALGYEVVRRCRLGQLLFGLKCPPSRRAAGLRGKMLAAQSPVPGPR
jgi:peptidoglycan/LPS O-acetylase OafA/YrhL